MGTRADYYVGLGPEMEWLGSTAWDGHPSSVFSDDIVREDRLFAGHGDETLWRQDVAELLASRDDSTQPERGWPWPWDDSGTSDYAYTYDPESQRVLGSRFGSPWFVVVDSEPAYDRDLGATPDRDRIGEPHFPDMASRKNVRHDGGSGAIFLSTTPREGA